jgi:leader peptidase (prepilin peptidase) / N-methyltransferase
VLPASPILSALWYIGATVLGLGAGVGVNALSDQVAGDEEPPWRSADCSTCRKQLPAARLFPLVGILLLKRQCPACGANLSLRRPLVDVGLAVAFPLLLAHAAVPGAALHLAPQLLWVVDAAIVTALALTFVVDLEHHLILDIVVYPLAAGLIVVALAFDHKALASMGIGAVICGGLFLLFYFLGFVLYHQEALGFGDVKLAALMGMAVGWPGVISALVLCAFIGAAVSVVLLGTGRVTTKTYIPFGTFLSLGAALALLVSAPLW